ncbi:MAG: TrbI/VirB10 family protein, partial [Polynucleobacter sp.]|nr:TrbI/VirB10 family protein [Polynucleobacter sp.]
AGIKGSVNNHVLARFSNAVLQTALSIGVSRASRSGGDAVFVAVPGQVGNALTQLPIFNAPNSPTINVPEGAKISIFVAKDLDFGTAGIRPS